MCTKQHNSSVFASWIYRKIHAGLLLQSTHHEATHNMSAHTEVCCMKHVMMGRRTNPCWTLPSTSYQNKSWDNTWVVVCSQYLNVPPHFCICLVDADPRFTVSPTLLKVVESMATCIQAAHCGKVSLKVEVDVMSRMTHQRAEETQWCVRARSGALHATLLDNMET